jgi:hypothetical protein
MCVCVRVCPLTSATFVDDLWAIIMQINKNWIVIITTINIVIPEPLWALPR